MSSSPLRLSKRARLLLGIPAVIVFAGVYSPILLSIALSFQGPLGGVTLPLNEPTVMWYQSLIDLSVITEHPDYRGQPLTDFRPSILRSLLLAATTALVSTFLGVDGCTSLSNEIPWPFDHCLHYDRCPSYARACVERRHGVTCGRIRRGARTVRNWSSDPCDLDPAILFHIPRGHVQKVRSEAGRVSVYPGRYPSEDMASCNGSRDATSYRWISTVRVHAQFGRIRAIHFHNG